MAGASALFVSAVGLGVAYCAAPGAVNTEAVRRGLARGFRPVLLVQLGSLIGDALWATLALTGTAFLGHNRSLRLVLGIAGACFLLRLAWSALQEAWRGGLPGA
ncbi:MAG: LysE family translocator, partial [Chloroflexota bacterium]|nr:LysE family translocator [Chloroflexota bacterium]